MDRAKRGVTQKKTKTSANFERDDKGNVPRQFMERWGGGGTTTRKKL